MPFDPVSDDSLQVGGRIERAERERSFVFARLGVEASERLSLAVREGKASATTAVLWLAVLRFLPAGEQRLSRSATEIAAAAGLSRPTAAKAWAELQRLGLICNPHLVGRATVWEVAADAATKLPETARKECAARQRRAAVTRAASAAEAA